VIRAGVTVTLALAAAAGTAPVGAQEVGSSPHPGDALRVYLVTFGVGDAVWEKFGHNAIRIVDEAAGTDIAWEWGIFDFRQQDFIPRLMKGTMMYNMGGGAFAWNVERYRAFDRDAWSQELNLTAAQKWALQGRVLGNWSPNRGEYRYDYYRDNCSTRIRDHLDAVLDGRIRAATAPDTTAHGYRWHTRRLLRGDPWAYAGIQLVLGNRAEEPITSWDEMFLPLRLRDHLRSIRVLDDSGVEVPLVLEETRILASSSRGPAPQAPPTAWPWFLLVGVVWGGLIVAASAGAPAGLAGRLATVAVAGGWSLLAGVGGAILLAAWALTDHVFWGWNENVAQVNPLSLLVGVGLLALVARPAPPRWTRALARVVALVSVLGLLLQALPGLDQVNGEILAAAVPPNLALAWAVGRRCRISGADGPR
jgi:hypothetical protein